MGGDLEPDSGDTGDELDQIIGALADKRRRYVLYHLSVTDGSVARSVLAERLGEWLGTMDSKRWEIELIHNHLPVMENAGLIDLDREAGSVSITRKGEIANEGRRAYVDNITANC